MKNKWPADWGDFSDRTVYRDVEAPTWMNRSDNLVSNWRLTLCLSEFICTFAQPKQSLMKNKFMQDTHKLAKSVCNLL